MQDIWGGKVTQHFYQLTPEKILDAVETTGFDCTGRALALNSMENRVYEIEIEIDPSDVKTPSDRFVIAKFYRPGRWSKEQIQDEHNFLRDLEDNEVPTVAPYLFGDNETIGVDEETGIYFTVFPKVGGRSPDELDRDGVKWVGRLLGRMHNVGAAGKSEHRLSLDIETFGHSNLKYLVDSGVLPLDIKDQYITAVESICSRVGPWFATAKNQRIHGDCHLGNLLWNDRGPFWVDFDDTLVGPPVQDIWLLLPGRDEYAREQLQLLLEGYELMRPFDRTTLRLIEPLRALRFIHFSSWIARRWEDPSFKRAFPDFSDAGYWQRQLSDLNDQLRVIMQSEWQAPESWPYAGE